MSRTCIRITPLDTKKCGTRSNYVMGCRCEPCQLVNREYHAIRYAERFRKKHLHHCDISKKCIYPGVKYLENYGWACEEHAKIDNPIT